MSGPVQKVECGLTLDNIKANVTVNTDPEEVQQLATNTQILTSRPDQLSGSNITAAAAIVNTILTDITNITEDTTVAVMTTVSQLLTVAPEQFTEDNNATVSLTHTLERFSVSHSNSNTSLVVQPRLAIQTVQVQNDQTTGIQFSALSGTSSNFTTNRIQLKRNVSEITDTEIPSDVQIFIKLPSDPSRKTSNVSVGFVLYENDLFFRSRAFRPSLNARRMVISGSLGGVTAEHVKLHFLPMNTSDKFLHDFACVFWDYSLNDWSTKGCFKTNPSTNVSTLQCQCNHTTNFAVLMSFRPSYQYAKALSDISIAGCSLSIVGLILTIIFQIITRKSRKMAPTILLVSLCVSMTVFYFLFLFGIENPDQNVSQNSKVSEENTLLTSDLYQDPDSGPCTALTALMQYFLLATFTWNTLYALHIFILIRKTLSGTPSGFLAASIVAGWGFPAVLVAITLGVTYRVDKPLGYRREEFCWLAALKPSGQFDFAKPMFWGFLLPVAVMLLFNTVVLIYFGINTCKKDPILSSTQNTSLRKLFMSNFSLGVLLGITWVLGYFVLGYSAATPTLSNILSIFFCLCNTTQGVQIFILFTVRTADFRKMFHSVTQSVSAPDLSLHKQVYELWKPKGRSQNPWTADYGSEGHFAQSETTRNL
ncbi:adhesion G-protein coupled receptor G7-like [Engraulis encrasicolus]|uniref:adhesion G-protein coupled receptor G7-like n=1 Tax=Engraulis encrasicolus TaxID=184585 RepID=UPI002FD21CB0